jgi:hypothetical protein
MFKKAQGMSINTIIIAIIVLVVLVVLVMIFTGYFGGWTGRVATCSSQAGICVTNTNTGMCQDVVSDSDVSPLGGKCFSSGTTVDATKICCPPGTRAKP